MSSRSRARRQQPRTRPRRGRGRAIGARSQKTARRANVKRRASANTRRQGAGPTRAKTETEVGGWLAALRERRAARASTRRERKQVARATSVEVGEDRRWPRRLAMASLKLGGTLALAWALLVAGREVYEYATTSARFEVQHFIYEPTAHVDDETLRELLAIEPGTNILALDLEALSERVVTHPWVAHATVVRNLPDTLEVEVVEHEPAAIVLAGRFYLVNQEGHPFKEVERGERGELPIITGIEREELRDAREQAEVEIGEGLAILREYEAKQRPRLGELHLADDGSVTLYTAASGTALHLGREEFAARLERWDALRAALGERADRLAIVHLDHESKPDRRDRVVARFTNERDEAVLLAAAQQDEAEDQRESEAASAASLPPDQRPARRAGRRNRIPSYE